VEVDVNVFESSRLRYGRKGEVSESRRLDATFSARRRAEAKTSQQMRRERRTDVELGSNGEVLVARDDNVLTALQSSKEKKSASHCRDPSDRFKLTARASWKAGTSSPP
jgi:hypothetical protein